MPILRNCALLISMSCSILLSVGCAASSSSRQQPPTPIEQKAFRDAQQLWNNGNIRQSMSAFETFLARYPNSVRAGEALIYVGRCHLDANNVTAAHAKFLQACRSSDRRVVARAQLELGDLRSRQEEYDNAATRYAQAAHAALDAETRQEALLRQGIALQRSGQFQQARQLLERLLAQHPTAAIAQRAERQLQVEPFFRVQVGLFQNENNAITRRTSLQREGIESELRPTQHHRYGACTAVLSGRFQTRGEAESHRDRIQRALGGEKPVILP